jgi:hypothetical protein
MEQEEKERKRIWLSNDVIKDGNLSADGLLAYIALRCILRSNYEYSAYYVSLRGLKYQLTGVYAYDNGFEKKIKSGVSELHKIGIVKMLDESKNDMLLDLSNLEFDTDKGYFTILYLDEVNSILNSGYQGRFALLKYFTAMIGTINHSKKGGETNDYYAPDVGTQTIAYLANMVSVTERTIMNYNAILVKIKLLYICNSTNTVRNEKGEIINSFSNAYGRPEHKKEIDSFQRKRECKNGNSGLKLSKDNANIRRSMKQRYNNICKKIENHLVESKDIPKIQEVYNFFLVQNENYDKKLKECEEKGVTFSNHILERGRVDVEPLKIFLEEKE